jgi:multidrug efflux pump subunit AcrB
VGGNSKRNSNSNSNSNSVSSSDSNGNRNSKSNSKVKIIIACVVLAAVVVGMYFVYKEFMPKPQDGSKNITIEVIIEDDVVRTVEISTDAEYLREALDEVSLIEGSESEYGFFITTVNGRTVDDSKQEWWMITKNGETHMIGVSETPIADGEKYELTLVVGY